MTYHVVRYPLAPGTSEQLNADMDELDAEVVSTSVFLDTMEVTAIPYLVVVARSREGALVTATVAPRQSISAASEEADVGKFNAWLNETTASAFDPEEAFDNFS